MFRVKQYGELSGWRPIEMTMPLEQQARCPCCTTALEVACALVGEDVTVHVGHCPHCGYLGYIDRPKREWFESFYNSEWDGQGQRDLEATAEKMRASYKQNDATLKLIQESGVDKDEFILEVGCGYGCAMQQLKEAGYSRVFGVEPCEHRAALVRQVFGHEVYSCEMAQLKKHGWATFDDLPYGMVYSSHVLEHTHDPTEMIRTAARLQDRGGLLSICVPRQETEPTMGVLLFLPHLHSFTACSLLHLLNKHGYGTMEIKQDAQSIYVLAIKTGRTLPVARGNTNGVDKIRQGLGGTWKSEKTSRFWWNYLNDGSGYVPEGKDWGEFSQHLQRPRFVYVEPCERKTDAPCEVQFEGGLKLCVK